MHVVMMNRVVTAPLIRAVHKYGFVTVLMPRLRSKSTKAVIAAKQPYQVEVSAGKTYAWCACGYSNKQPFCDGSHKTHAHHISSLRFTPETGGTVWLCGCKYTNTPPYCDGTHKHNFVQSAELLSVPKA